MKKLLLNKNIKWVVFTIATNLIVYCSYTQNLPKKRLIDEKILYSLLEDNFRKDEIISIYDKENKLLDTLVEQYKEQAVIQSLRIDKLKSINTNLESQRSLLEANNKTLTDSNYNLNLYLDRKNKEIQTITDKNKRKRKWIVGFAIENVLDRKSVV